MPRGLPAPSLLLLSALSGRCFLTFRLEGVDEEVLVPALKAEVEEVVHVCCAA